MLRAAVSIVVFCACVSGASGAPIEDLESPMLVNLWFTPVAVDCSLSDQPVILHWKVADNLSGIDAETHLRLDSPSGASSGNMAKTLWLGECVDGDPQAGVYDLQFVMPRYSELGTWTVNRLWMWDAVGNLRSHASSLPAYLSAQGIEPPTITVGPSAPEPSTWAMLALAACILTSSRRVARAAYTRR